MEQGSIRHIRMAVLGLAILATVFCLALMLWSGRPSDPLWWLGAVFFMIWVFAPYVLLWLAAYRPLKRFSASILLLLGSLLTIAVGIGTYIDAFLLTDFPDAQVGLLFLFIPPWQVLLASATWASSLWADRRR